MNNKNKSCIFFAFISMPMTFCLLGILYFRLKIVPFGNNTVTCWDAEIQYLDFFAYLHDVLHGKASIFYSFSKTLGGTNIAVFSYYLSSPLNLIVYFFEKENLHAFFTLIVSLKLSLVAFSCTFYILNRFSSIKKVFAILLGISFALCQYSFTQASNIMWLDGLIMLPFISLGLYKFIHKGKFLLLTMSTALSLLFNWYTGFINCIFAAFFFVFEWALYESNQTDGFSSKRIRSGILLGIKCALFMILGIMIASFLLLPTFISLKNGRGHIDFNRVKKLTFYLDFPSIIQGFNLGATSSRRQLSLFSSSLVIIGMLGIFLLPQNKISKNKKTVIIAMTVVCILFFCWTPFFTLFSLLKDASSYWFRYSYIGIFFMVFCASLFYENADFDDSKKIFKTIFLWGMLILFLNYVNPQYKRTSETVTLLFLTYFVYTFAFSKKNKLQAFSLFILTALCCTEIVLNGNMLLKMCKANQNVEEFKKYTKENKAIINNILSADSSNYRISQTSTRLFNFEENHTANYNEALAFSYKSISGYTSDPDDRQRTFLDSLGYNKNGDNFNIVNTSIIPSDSLLGVKYILSRYPIKGLSLRKDFLPANKKSVYENPFCLPQAFSYSKSENQVEYRGNPFEYINSLYSELLGYSVKIFSPVNYTLDKDDSRIKKWLLYPSKKGLALYGKINCGFHDKMFMNVNGFYKQKYAGWCSPTTVYIPCESENAEILLESKDDFSVTDIFFYQCDLEVLKSAIEELNANAAEEISVKDGLCTFIVNGKSNLTLHTSIPYNSGWTIFRNGQKVQADLFANCLIDIPLEEGRNEIIMRYKIPGHTAGILLTILGLALLINRFYTKIKKNIQKFTHFYD